MRRGWLGAIVAGVMAVGVLAWPASAQPSERVIMDAVFWTWPVPVADTCLELPAGHMSVTIGLEGDEPTRPVTLSFGGSKSQTDTAVRFDIDAARDPATWQGTILGGRYCYAILNRAVVPAGAGAGSAGPIGYEQRVALKIAVATP